MTYRTVPEAEFRERVNRVTQHIAPDQYGCVTGPGRSGAVAAVYTSHQLGIPFIPYGQEIPKNLQPVLVVDTATWTGRTIRKAARKYGPAIGAAFAYYKEGPGAMVKFWYERNQ